MATITIRNTDEPLKARLRFGAATHGYSMEDEVRDILRTALATEPESGQTLVASIRARIEPLGGMEIELPPREAMRLAHDFSA